MNTSSKIVVAALIVGAAIGAVLGHSFWPTTVTVRSIAGASPVGSTFGDAKIAQIVFAPSTTAIASATVLTNTDSNDRVVTSWEQFCTGLGTLATPGPASWIISAATSTAGTTTPPVNTNFLLNTTIATTSTPLFTVSSTTPGQIGTGINRVWPAGTTIVLWSQSTTSAVCNEKFGYIGT